MLSYPPQLYISVPVEISRKVQNLIKESRFFAHSFGIKLKYKFSCKPLTSFDKFTPFPHYLNEKSSPKGTCVFFCF